MTAADRMRAENLRRQWLGWLAEDETQELFRKIREELLTKRLQRITSINCPRCRTEKKVDIEVEVYRLADIMRFFEFFASYGLGKPVEAQEVHVKHELTGPWRELDSQGLAALEARIEAGEVTDAEYRELTA